jgi:AraC family transcriptional activator of pobA
MIRQKDKSLPINTMVDHFDGGISIKRATIRHLQNFDVAAHPHRDDYHLFYLQEKGTTPITIDFQKHSLQPFSITYVHPSQVHQIGPFENITASFLAINNENLNVEHLRLLEEIVPVTPFLLDQDSFSIIVEAITLCINLSERKHERLFQLILKDSCNTLVGLIASQFLEKSTSTDTLSRYELITKAFKASLEHSFISNKKPTEYAQVLNISTAYLNECVKNTTGHTVSYHIQQRIILEGKRLLYHTDKSVKEIASDLGYQDYPYFSRLFTKVTGMTALTFRTINRE